MECEKTIDYNTYQCVMIRNVNRGVSLMPYIGQSQPQIAQQYCARSANRTRDSLLDSHTCDHSTNEAGSYLQLLYGIGEDRGLLPVYTPWLGQ
ncbi:hypothetical protein SFRURICE_005092, partial [Spodoptera frugiperda]